MPERIQLSRRKGWRKPPNTVNVARPSKWGNPFSVEKCGTRAKAAATFKQLMTAPQTKLLEIAGGPVIFGLVLISWRERAKRDLHELRGKNLACWCPLDEPCHADVLLQLANAALSPEAKVKE